MVNSINSDNSGFIRRLLGKAQDNKESSFQKLSSGKRVNSAKDDAAGLAIAAALSAEQGVFNQGIRNASDGISIANIFESSLNEVSDIGTRMQELAMQAGNGTLSQEQRVALNEEYQALKAEQDRIINTTEFNGKKVFNEEIQLQVGKDASANSQIAIPSVSASNIVGEGDLLSAESALNALDSLGAQSEVITSKRAELGAATARLETAIANNRVAAENLAAAESRIMDVDVAFETAKLAAESIKAQAGTAMLAQANQTQQTVSKLIGSK